MSIMCVKLGAESNFASKIQQPAFGPDTSPVAEEIMPSRASNEEALGMGDYRDILSLTRVLVHGPQSKADVDIVIDRYISQQHCFVIWSKNTCLT